MGRVWDATASGCRLVRLRMDRPAQGRIDPSDVLQERLSTFRARSRLRAAAGHAVLPVAALPDRAALQLLPPATTSAPDARRGPGSVAAHGAMPQATSISLAAQLLGRFTSVTQACSGARCRSSSGSDQRHGPIDREIGRCGTSRSFHERRPRCSAQASAASIATSRLSGCGRFAKTPGFFDNQGLGNYRPSPQASLRAAVPRLETRRGLGSGVSHDPQR